MDELLELARAVVVATRAERHLLSDEGQRAFAELARWLGAHHPAQGGIVDSGVTYYVGESCPGSDAQE